MRFKSILFSAVIVCASFTPCMAYEKFIPLGAGYSTGVSSLPSLNSDAQSLTVQTDIYETELYLKQLEERKHKSAIKQFFTNSDFSTPDPFAY